MDKTAVNNHRGERQKSRFFKMLSATVLNKGNLCFQDEAASYDAKPASDETWDTSLSVTQKAFALHFAGMSMNRSKALEVLDVDVAEAGLVGLNIASGTFEIGQMVGPAKHATEDELLNDTVVVVTDVLEAIGKISRKEEVATTAIEVEIFGKQAHM